MNGAFILRLRTASGRRARIGLILVALAALLGWTGSWHWFPELFSHFFSQYALLLIMLTALLFWENKASRWAWAALLLTLLVGFAVSPFWLPVADANVKPGADTRHLNLLQFNAARNTYPLVQWLIRHRQEVDVVLALEADTGFAAGMEALAAEFPYRIDKLQDDSFGIALISRYPLYEAKVLEVIGADFPALEAHVITPAGPLHVIGIHPPPPLGGELAKLRDDYMKELAGQLAQQLEEGEPTLVFGDFNSSIWSPRLREFMAETGLRDAQQGQGALGSWPAITARYSGLLGIPIDLMLVSESVTVQQRQSGEYLDSDHLPVLTQIAY
ncbi:MAG: endonuclease/exonuclease/phosphatase family protein [Zoogloeaceae bacterium]|jgi:endonuclease/exonuclease/phosphatase (EEP) superfamily protein YafD|nr:endonuclease/exonuclease/phosphatase family protein [Zoogloeaceae bacterium]